MGHNITAIILKGDYKKELAFEHDLLGINLGFDLTMFPIDHYYSACWQSLLKTDGYLDKNNLEHVLFPNEYALYVLMKKISYNSDIQFAILLTDYFGGMGNQYATVYENDTIADKNITTISAVLRYLGVKKENGFDEFDTVGLSNHRSNPEYLEKYYDLADELGV